MQKKKNHHHVEKPLIDWCKFTATYLIDSVLSSNQHCAECGMRHAYFYGNLKCEKKDRF